VRGRSIWISLRNWIEPLEIRREAGNAWWTEKGLYRGQGDEDAGVQLREMETTMNVANWILRYEKEFDGVQDVFELQVRAVWSRRWLWFRTISIM
jgi:hypothetical protein